MAAAAGRAALEAAGLTVADLDMIIVGTISGDTPMPACAVHVQQKLGADVIPSFDVSAALRRLRLRHDHRRSVHRHRHAARLRARHRRRAALAPRRTGTTAPPARSSATAPARWCSGPRQGDGRGILSTRIHADGSLRGLLQIPGGGSAEPLTPRASRASGNKVHMTGSEVFQVAIKNLTSASTLALKAAGLTSAELDWVVAHQANPHHLDRSRIGSASRARSSSSTSRSTATPRAPRSPSRSTRRCATGASRAGQTVLLCALGAGISWGAAIVRM